MSRVQIPALPLSSHGILWGLSFPIYKMKIKVFTYDMLWVELCPPTFASVSPTPVPRNVTGSLQRNSGWNEGPNPIGRVSMRWGEIWTERHIDGRWCEEHTERNGYLQTKERGLEETLPRGPQKDPGGLLVSKTVRWYISVTVALGVMNLSDYWYIINTRVNLKDSGMIPSLGKATEQTELSCTVDESELVRLPWKMSGSIFWR